MRGISSPAFSRIYLTLRKMYDVAPPPLQRVLTRVNRFTGVRPPVRFSGWGMSSEHYLPWEDDPTWAHFEGLLTSLEALELSGANVSREELDGLRWRHWVVAFAARRAAVMARPGELLRMAECGVADGLTAFVALSEFDRSGRAYHAELYDAWAAMDADRLTPSEARLRGKYRTLSLDLCQRNLARFTPHCDFRAGYLPETLDELNDAPIHFLHIDLNSAKVTEEVFRTLSSRLSRTGLVLFDDYGWLGFEDTRAVIDRVASEWGGALLKLPTGQAILFPGPAAER